jgi:hypothetical protein
LSIVAKQPVPQPVPQVQVPQVEAAQ